MVKICHISDWHSQFGECQQADVYVITGDMLPNYPIIEPTQDGGFGMFGGFERTIDHAREARLQRQWFDQKFASKGKTLRKFLKSPDAPVVLVRGNHDFTDLGPMFGGDYFEVNEDPSRTVDYCGLRFGGFRGINYIAGEWADEKTEEEMQWIVDDVPDGLDVLVSHGAPYRILDEAFGCNYGLNALTGYINKRTYDDTLKMPRLFCFGHIHSSLGLLEWDDGTLFSNASTGKRVIELEI